MANATNRAADRRRRVRVPVQKTVRHTGYQAVGAPVYEQNDALDLSSGGISFESSRSYKKGDLVLLEVELEGEKIQILTCIAWTKAAEDGSRFQCGGEIMAIDPSQRKKLQSNLGKLMLTHQEMAARAAKKKTASEKSKKKSAKKKTIQKAPKRKPASKKKAKTQRK